MDEKELEIDWRQSTVASTEYDWSTRFWPRELENGQRNFERDRMKLRENDWKNLEDDTRNLNSCGLVRLRVHRGLRQRTSLLEFLEFSLETNRKISKHLKLFLWIVIEPIGPILRLRAPCRLMDCFKRTLGPLSEHHRSGTPMFMWAEIVNFKIVCQKSPFCC